MRILFDIPSVPDAISNAGLNIVSLISLFMMVEISIPDRYIKSWVLARLAIDGAEKNRSSNILNFSFGSLVVVVSL